MQSWIHNFTTLTGQIDSGREIEDLDWDLNNNFLTLLLAALPGMTLAHRYSGFVNIKYHCFNIFVWQMYLIHSGLLYLMLLFLK